MLWLIKLGLIILLSSVLDMSKMQSYKYII